MTTPRDSTGTMLEAELLEAAAVVKCCDQATCQTPGNLLAARLRARAERVRQLGSASPEGTNAHAMWKAITGRLPPDPTERGG